MTIQSIRSHLKFISLVLAVSAMRGSAAPPTETDATAVVRVMSFNIRLGTAEDGPNHWNLRKELVIKTVRQFAPDVLGTQEVMGFQSDFLRQELADYEYHGTSRIPEDADQEQCAVFYRKSRFEKLRSGHFWLSQTPDVPGSNTWGAAFPRMVSWVELHERSRPGCVFFVFNTHFDHRGSEARLQSAAILRTRIREIAAGVPSIVTGDFNSADGSLPQQILLHATDRLALTDSYRSQHPTLSPDDESTTSRWNGKRDGARIDWILTSSHWRVLQSSIDRTNQSGRYPSDHYPVQAVLAIRHSP